MRQVAIGCAGAIVSLIIGVALTVGFFSIDSRSTIETPMPVPSGLSKDVSISASAAFLNAQIQQAVRQTNLLKQATVTLNAPNIVQVVAVVDVTILGQRINTNVTVTMRVTVRNNRIALTVEKVDTGSVPVPQSMINSNIESLRAQAENQINAVAQRALNGTGLRLSNVRITPSEMIVDLLSQ